MAMVIEAVSAPREKRAQIKAERWRHVSWSVNA